MIANYVDFDDVDPAQPKQKFCLVYIVLFLVPGEHDRLPRAQDHLVQKVHFIVGRSQSLGWANLGQRGLQTAELPGKLCEIFLKVLSMLIVERDKWI